VDLEGEVGPEDVVTDESALGRVLDGDAQPLDGERVLGANVEVALLRADGERGDRQSLKDRVRVPSRMLRSMNAPGSPSSALTITYFCSPGAFLARSHLMPVGKPAPPRPLRPDALSSSMTSRRRV